MTAGLRRINLTLCLLGISTVLCAAEPESGLCPPGFGSAAPAKPISTAADDPRIFISADSAQVDSESVTVFEGKVKARQANQTLEADYIRYDRESGWLDAKGNLIYTIDGLTGQSKVSGDSIRLNLNTNQGVILNSEYFTGAVNGRGQAESINIQSKVKFELNSASYTTCPAEDEAWKLFSGNVAINNETRQGSATNAILSIADIPVFYFPYLRFPVGDQRLSGFLFPGITVSNRHGTEITIPYYWDIAPNMDATITPRNMTRRGLMLQNEFRYLSENYDGIVSVDYLPNDKLFERDRREYSWIHKSQSTAGWSSAVEYRSVSDPEYIDDFSDTLASSSITHLNRQGALTYNHENFVFDALLQNYQRIAGVQPYARVPQLHFNTRTSNQYQGLGYDFNSEYVRFEHNDLNKIVGERILLSPFTTYPIQSDAGFFIPKLTVHHLQYNLDHLASPNDNSTPSVTVPVFNADMGLFFERDTNIAGIDLLQTLEPRLYYLYGHNADHSEIPVFDTGLTTFSSSQIFLNNRFSGGDRIGDANQLTMSLATRFYRQDNGAEIFNALIGQIAYFSDRHVTLPGGITEDAHRSDYVASFSFTPNPHFSMSSEFIVNKERERITVNNNRVSYLAGKDLILNYDYRYRHNELQSMGVSAAWRINPRWQFFAKHESDRFNKHRLENFLGVRYDSCCWAIRLVGHEFFDKLVDGNPRYESAILLEFELKGLSSIGSRKKIDTLLEDGILGYVQ